MNTARNWVDTHVASITSARCGRRSARYPYRAVSCSSNDGRNGATQTRSRRSTPPDAGTASHATGSSTAADPADPSSARRKVSRVWPPRPGRLAVAGAAVAVAVALVVLVATGSPVAAARALPAAAIAAATIGLALSLPGITGRGLAIGAFL